jgi:hypothetical protein
MVAHAVRSDNERISSLDFQHVADVAEHIAIRKNRQAPTTRDRASAEPTTRS